ncbi:hypothetical protein BG46_13445 [Brucella anthropi]|nr:hypothetical protein BG46_13445 [Brucella anthropi]KIU68696.1 hypothetical protein TR92_09440 [Brucella anthropi]
MPPNFRFVTTGNLDAANHPVIPRQTLELNESEAILFPIKMRLKVSSTYRPVFEWAERHKSEHQDRLSDLHRTYRQHKTVR